MNSELNEKSRSEIDGWDGIAEKKIHSDMKNMTIFFLVKMESKKE